MTLKSASVMDDALAVVAIVGPRRGRGSRQKCKCCKKLVTHQLFANGMCMGLAGCELQVWKDKRAIEKKRGFR